MNSLNKKMFRLVTLTLIVSLANILAFASVPSAGAPVGILNSTNSRSAFVNGNLAEDGMTILSGSELRSDKGEVNVNLGSLGEVDLGENTSAVVTYNDTSVQLNVLKGEATLTTYKGVTGVLNTADGQSLQTDTTAASSTVNSTGMPATSGTKQGVLHNNQTEIVAAGILATLVAMIIIIGTRNNKKNVSPVR